MTLPREPRPAAAVDELFAVLRKYSRDRALEAGAGDVPDFESALLHLQKLANIGQLTLDIGLDFGNVMTIVHGYSDLVIAAFQEGKPPDPEHLAELRHAAEQASTLTTRLLTHGRETSENVVPLDLSRLVGEVSALLVRLLGPRGGLAVRTDPPAGTVIADPRHIEQLVLNLVLNARDATAGGGRIELSVDPIRLTAPLPHAFGTASAGDYARLRVRDDGRGMTPETIGKLFQPFFTTKKTGSGLGMTVVAGIARKCNAAVIVDSIVGTGTIVDVYFPTLKGR
jgi:two-component system, cell cycle sensor histidine kinase and response regulator CckA